MAFGLNTWFLDSAGPWGTHYMPTPTITLNSYDAGANVAPRTVKAVGATTWTALDGNHQVVGTGTMLATATSITVVSGGTWVGGGACKPGHYTVYTNSGTNGVVVGTVMICPLAPDGTGSKLYTPGSTDTGLDFNAWLGSGIDRDYYAYQPSYNPSGGYNGGGFAASNIMVNRGNDPYYTGPQDSARPHKLWLAPAPQSATSPSTADWQALATAAVAAGYTGAYYELPTNEWENAYSGGASTANLNAVIARWNTAAAAILAIDPTAKMMGPCTGGIFNNMTLAQINTFIAGCTSPLAAVTAHHEQPSQNGSNITMLRNEFSAVKAQFVASGVPNMDLWMTETGITEGQYGVIQLRRAARQRTVFRMVTESFGWAKENHYDFTVTNHEGFFSGYMIDTAQLQDHPGNVRSGAYALHVMGEALHGTTCNPTNYPATLTFGAPGSVADTLFFGTHYTGSTRDVVVLATNGIDPDVYPDSVTLQVSNLAGITCWDGWGAPRALTYNGSNVTIPVDDLLTYVFLAPGTTVSVVDTGSKACTTFGLASNLATVASSVLNASAVNVAGVLNNGSFQENEAGLYGVGLPGAVPPFNDATVPDTYTFSNFFSSALPQTVDGIAIFSGDEPFQGYGCSLVSFNILATIAGVTSTVATYTCPSAVSYPIPSASCGNNDDACVRSTWWKAPRAWLIPLSLSGPVTDIRVNITATGYGGQPDSAASTATGGAVGPEGTAQRIKIAEIQIYQINRTSVGPKWVSRGVG